MSKRRIVGAVGVLALALGALAVSTAPATATGSTGGHPCRTVTHSDEGKLSVVGTGKAKLTKDGVYLKTPAQDDKASWRLPLQGTLADVTALTYRTKAQALGAGGLFLPAVKLELTIDGQAGSLVFEPIYTYGNDAPKVNTVQSWDAVNGAGNAKAGLWWWSKEPGNLQTLKPFSAWLAAHGDAPLAAVRLELGTYNTGAAAWVRSMKLKTDGKCRQHQWWPPKVTPTPTPTVTVTPSASATPTPTASATPTATASASATATATSTPSGSTSPTASASVPATASPSVSTSPVGATVPGGGLPVTGSRLWLVMGLGALAVAAGGAVVALTRRRRVAFTSGDDGGLSA